MKPKTIIAMLGILALLAAFSLTARAADDEQAKADMAACIAERNAACADLTGEAMKDCKAQGAAFCQAIHKGAFRAAVDYEFIKRPDTIAAQATMKADKSAQIISVSKPTADYFGVTVAKTTVSADGIVDEKVHSLNVTKVPADTLKVVEGADMSGIIITPMVTLDAALVEGDIKPTPIPGPTEEPCGADLAWMEEGIELTDEEATALEDIGAMFEAITGILLDPWIYLDLDGNGIVDAIDFELAYETMATVSDADVDLAIGYLADVASLFDMLIDDLQADGRLVVFSSEYDPSTGECSTEEVADPAGKLHKAKKTVIKEVAGRIAGGKEEPPSPPPVKCLAVCDYDNNGDCLGPLEPECNACSSSLDCNMGTEFCAAHGCFDPNTATCLAPDCYYPY